MPNPNEFWGPSYQDRLSQSRVDRERMESASMRGSFTDNNIYREFHRIEPLWTSYESMIGSYGSGGKTEEQKNAVGVKVLKEIKEAARTFSANEKNGEQAISKADEYRALGLTKIANVVDRKANKVLKELSIAAAGYKRINRAELDKFQKELSAVSDMRSKRHLEETPLALYVGQGESHDTVKEAELAIPPADVLEKLRIARDAKLFDDFSILHIKYVPDPILCGRINESSDLYFIAEWGDDVKLSDIVK